MAVSGALPAHKFMDIFKNAASNTQLYNNRMEALGITIKMLGRYMGSADIDAFMGAFKDRFRNQNLQTRVGHVLKTGADVTQDVLGRDFQARFNLIAKDMGGTLGEEFNKALTSGDFDAALDVISKAASGGSEFFNKQAESDARQLVVAEKLRRSGRPEDLASALKLGGIESSFAMLETQVMKISKQDIRQTGITGIAEVVAEHMGLSTKEIELYNRTIMGERSVRDNLRASGGLTTGNLELDKILKDQNKLNEKLSNEELRAALYQTEEFTRREGSAEEMVKAQLSVTQSISDKFSTIVEYWLQWIYKILEGIAGSVKDVLGWLSIGNKDRTGDAQELRRQAKNLVDPKTGLPYSGDKNVAAKSRVLMDVADALSGGDSMSNAIKNYMNMDDGLWKQYFGYTGTKTERYTTQDPITGKTFTSEQEVGESIDAYLARIPQHVLRGGLTNLINSDDFSRALNPHGGARPSENRYLDSSKIDPLARKALGMDRVADQEIPHTLWKNPEFAKGYKQATDDNLLGENLPPYLKDMIKRARLDIQDERAAKKGTKYDASKAAGVTAPSLAVGVSGAAATAAEAGTRDDVTKTAEAAGTTATSTAATADHAEDLVAGIQTANKTLSGGMTFDSGFMNGEFKTVMIDAMNRGMDAPLMRHAVLLAAIMHNPSVGDFISTNAFSTYGALGTYGFLENVFGLQTAPTDADDVFGRIFTAGGAVPTLPTFSSPATSGAVTSSSSAGKAAGNVYYTTFYINEASDASAIGTIVEKRMKELSK
jgi:hypothetical protein